MLRLDLRAVLLLFCVVTCVSGMRREYFLKIEEVSWNYAPTGMNIIQNRSIQDDQ
uniref:Spondin domain-containing protein n=1 Tax=Neolamprologus brichardi TaxID=32507 RepID=A0A3Q4H259_NEOBR